jgi:hypothetical protein
MTAGHDGTPENDDPFGYLYRSEGGGEQPDPAGGQPRTPRTSYNQVQRVGERRVPQGGPHQNPRAYPNQPPAGGYGYPPQQAAQPQARQPYGQGQNQGYGSREHAAPHQQPPGGGRRGGPDAPNRKGLLIGAVAVVAAVAVGIAFAMTNSSGDDNDKKAGGQPSASAPVTSAAPTTTQASESPTPAPFDSKKVDATTLTLAGGAQQSSEWSGAGTADGTYVDHLTGVGASVLWTVSVPEDGSYTFFISYGNAGEDATLTLGVNGTPRAKAVNLQNYGHYTEWDKAWSNHTYQWVDLHKGANTLSLTCAPGNQCGVNLEQVWLKQGQVEN